MAHRLLLRPAVLVLAAVLAACGVGPTSSPDGTGGPPTASPGATPAAPAATGTPHPPTEAKLAEIREGVAAIRGLQPEGNVEPTVIDEATLRANLEAEFDVENTPEELAIAEDLYVSVGLLEPGVSLRAASLDLLAGQVAGYYSPEQDELFVVSRSGGVGPVEWSTYAHEFTHQLQDQHFDLDALGLDATDQSDRSLAVLALVEGDAVAAQSAWMQQSLTAAELGEIFQASIDPAALDVLRRAPAIVRETSLFPYEGGFAFVSTLLGGGGYEAVDAAYADPPASTEQLLHPEKYLAREAPVEVAVPAGLAAALGDGWTEAARDTFGEELLRFWLREGGVAIPAARAAAAGWGGDRLVLLRGPDGRLATALVTEWDSAADAAEFATNARSAISGLGVAARVIDDGIRVSIAFGDDVADLAAALGG
jgi:hypothetical protein